MDDLDLLLQKAVPHQPQRWEWFRFDPDLVVDAATLPTPIFDLLPGAGTNRVSKSYPTPGWAMKALQTAVERYRKGEALPPQPDGFVEVAEAHKPKGA